MDRKIGGLLASTHGLDMFMQKCLNNNLDLSILIFYYFDMWNNFNNNIFISNT